MTLPPCNEVELSSRSDDSRFIVTNVVNPHVVPIQTGQPMAIDKEGEGDGGGTCPIKKEDIEDECRISFELKHIEGLSGKLYSDPIMMSRSRWRILCYPRGNRSQTNQYGFLSLYLDCLDDITDWYVWGQLCVRSSVKDLCKTVEIPYYKEKDDWGYSDFISLDQLMNPINGYINSKDTVNIEARVILCKGHASRWMTRLEPGSKHTTGFVGLKNQGATCYMNSLLQALYFTNALRKAVYQIPILEGEKEKKLPLSLQRVFYNLQTSKDDVCTEQLTESFGWNSAASFMQHDVQEFNRVLCDSLDTSMKGTSVEGTLSRLFEGTMKSYITCININYESSRTEPFYDIQLNVKGMTNIYRSFEDYVSEETLEGENLYMAGAHGLQPAKKGVIFQRLPPVLHLQLKRFEYDVEADAMVKINDYFQFEETMNLDRFLESPESTPADYVLQSVLVHTGNMQMGHYIAYIRPTGQGNWFRFDDDHVEKATRNEAMNDNFGVKVPTQQQLGHRASFQSLGINTRDQRYTNAYMLVYIRESSLAEVLAPVGPNDMPLAMVTRFTEEMKALQLKQKEERERHLYMFVQVAVENDFKLNKGPGLTTFKPGQLHHFADYHMGINEEGSEAKATVHSHYPMSLKIKRDMKWSDFVILAAHKTGKSPDQIRFWMFDSRSNKTIRPGHRIHCRDDQQVQSLRYKLQDLLVFMEVIQPTIEKLFFTKTVVQCIIFFKFYDPITGDLSYVGHLDVSLTERICDLYPSMRKMAGLDEYAPIVVYEEVSQELVEKCLPENTLAATQIGTGDILIFQLEREVHKVSTDSGTLFIAASDNSLSSLEGAKLKYPMKYPETVPEFFEDWRDRVNIVFREYNIDPKVHRKDRFTLPLSRKMTYQQLTETLGEHAKVDPAYLRLYTHDYIHNTYRGPLRRPQPTDSILNLMPSLQNRPHQYIYETVNSRMSKAELHILYYETLEYPLVELASKVFIKVTYRDAIGKESEMKLLLPKGTKVHTLMDEARKMNGSVDQSLNLRMIMIIRGRIAHYLNSSYTIDHLDFSPNAWYRIDELSPEFELAANCVDGSLIVAPVCHFHKDFHTHGSPFHFILRKGELFAHTRERLMAAAFGGKPVDPKWKIAVLCHHDDPYFVEEASEQLFDLFMEFKNNDQKPIIGIHHLPPRLRNCLDVDGAVVIHN